MTARQHLLGGALIAGDGPDFTRPGPIDGENLPVSRLATPRLVDRAVSAAGGAWGDAAGLSIAARAAVLRTLADRLDASAETLAETITLENGCPKDQAVALQVQSASGLLRAYADLVERHAFTEARRGLRGCDVTIQKHPVGIAAGIVPWNVPVFLACMKLGPAIAAGCPIILKPSPENALSMGLFATELAALDLPGGMVQLLTGDRDLGEALVKHAHVAKVSFTGSTAAGRAVGKACAERFARCTLELGGKSAAILLDDLDLDEVMDQLFLAMLQNNGQVCGAQSRVLAPRRRFGEIAERLSALFTGLIVGDQRHSDIDIGPVATLGQKLRIDGFVERAAAASVGVLATAPIPASNGAYVAPTLFMTDDPDTEIAREEVFGPVTVLMPYDREEDAVALANDSAYGLSGSVWSADADRAVALARRLRTGTVGINSKKILDFGAPFGGFRSSGVGRELGPEGIDAFLESSAILAPAQ